MLARRHPRRRVPAGAPRRELDETTPRISETFAAMAAAAIPDPSRHAVEFYRRRDEIHLLFPVRG